MNGLAFFDSNILVYSDDSSDPSKQERAISLFGEHLRLGTAVVSLQVLQEYFVVATRKLKLDADVAQRKVELIAQAKVVSLSAGDVIAAIELHRLKRVSFWDVLIVQAARLAAVAVLYTEDLSPSSTLGGVRVVNPFTA